MPLQTGRQSPTTVSRTACSQSGDADADCDAQCAVYATQKGGFNHLTSLASTKRSQQNTVQKPQDRDTAQGRVACHTCRGAEP